MMVAARSLPVFVTTFAVAYSVLYVIAVEYNWALFTYHPAAEEFHFLVKPAKDAPAMYWYGWMATAALAAFVIAAVTSWLPGGVARRLWSGWSWVIPLTIMGVFCYLLRGFFIR
jgi:hypothetical protein